jgi:hypothetical protein
MINPQKTIIVKDDGHIDPMVWFGRYGMEYEIEDQTSEKNPPASRSADAATIPQLIIKTTDEGLRRWRLGIHSSKKHNTKGWQTLELRLFIMKHGTTKGFQLQKIKEYNKIVEFYA